MTSKPCRVFSLRPMGLDDVDRIAVWFADFDDVALFERSLPVPVSAEYVLEMWKSGLDYTDPPKALWFIAEDEDGKPAGVCGLQSINYIHGDAVVPIFVEAAMRGKGLALAISDKVVDLAFDRLRLHRLTTFFREDNEATRAITSKIGFVEEGRLRQAWFSEGQHKDVVQMGLLKSDWLDHRDSLREKLETAGNVRINMRHASE